MFFETKIQDVLDWSHSRNIINGSTYHFQYMKGTSEWGEVGDAILKNNKSEVEKEIGDVLVCLINMCEMMDITLIQCLEAAYDKIKYRNGIMFNGVFVKEGDDNYERIVKHVRGNINEIK